MLSFPQHSTPPYPPSTQVFVLMQFDPGMEYRPGWGEGETLDSWPPPTHQNAKEVPFVTPDVPGKAGKVGERLLQAGQGAARTVEQS